MRPLLKITAIALLCTAAIQGRALAMVNPVVASEIRIASQQGQFATLHDACGAEAALAVIGGGAVAVWRGEMSGDQRGTVAERPALETVSDDPEADDAAPDDKAPDDKADGDIAKDLARCENWRRQAALTLHSTGHPRKSIED